MRVLVTGSAGFVGQALVRSLASSGHEVTALVHRASTTFPRGVRVRRVDLLDPAGVRAATPEMDGVCHLAGATQVRQSLTAPMEFFRTNVVGTLNLLEALEHRTVTPPAMVLVSTATVYAAAPEPLNEDSPVRPANPYAASKHAAEEATRWQAATGRLGAVILRPFNVAGAVAGHGDPDHTRLIPKAVAVAAGHEKLLVVNGDGTAVRDFVHVADFVAAVEIALAACAPGRCRIYNVSGASASVTDVIRTVEQVTGGPLPTRHAPAQPESPVMIGDCTRIRVELGWRPRRSSLRQIVQDAWEVERLRSAR